MFPCPSNDGMKRNVDKEDTVSFYIMLAIGRLHCVLLQICCFTLLLFVQEIGLYECGLHNNETFPLIRVTDLQKCTFVIQDDKDLTHLIAPEFIQWANPGLFFVYFRCFHTTI